MAALCWSSLEEISSLSHSVVFLYFFAWIAEEGFLILLFFGAMQPDVYIFPFLLCFWTWDIFFGGVQHSPVYGCSAVSCNFGVLTGEDEYNCAVVWAFFDIAFLWYWNENWPFEDRQVMVERSDRMWSTGEGNGKPIQYSCLENPMNSKQRQNDRILKEELPRLVGAQYATGDQWIDISPDNLDSRFCFIQPSSRNNKWNVVTVETTNE